MENLTELIKQYNSTSNEKDRILNGICEFGDGMGDATDVETGSGNGQGNGNGYCFGNGYCDGSGFGDGNGGFGCGDCGRVNGNGQGFGRIGARFENSLRWNT